MDLNCHSFLGNVLYSDSSVLKTITGKFFPSNKNRQFLDISTLKYHELVVFSEFFPSINEELSSITFKLEDACVDFWNYSLEGSPFDLILVLDCTQNFHLFSLKSLPTPHSKHNCPFVKCKIPNFISRFPDNTNHLKISNKDLIDSQETKANEPNIFNNQFLIKNEFSISLFKNRKTPKIDFIRPYKYNRKFLNSNPIIAEKLIPKCYISIDRYTGYIIVCLNSSSFLIIPSLTLNKDGIIEQIELKIQTENLFHFDSLKYKLESISFVKTCKNQSKIQPVVFSLLSDLKDRTLVGKAFLFDWNNLIKNQPNPKDSHYKPISETNFIPLFNSVSTSLSPQLYHMRIFCTHIPVVHMKTIHVGVGRSEIDKTIPVFACANVCGYEYSSECVCKFKKLLFIFSYERNELKLILSDLETGELKEDILIVNLKEYYQEKIYIDLRDVLMIEENANEQRMKFLISSKCMEMFLLNIQFKDNRMKDFDLIKIQINSLNLELSDISSICPYQYSNEDSSILKSLLVSSTFGVIKKISFPSFNQEYILAPKSIEILKVERAIMVQKYFENSIILAAKKYQCFWDIIKGSYQFQYDFILRYIFLNSPKISTLSQFPIKKKGVLGISLIPVKKNSYLLLYSKLFESQVYLLIRKEFISENKYGFKKIQINNFLLTNHTTILCVKICHNLILQVTESQIILYQGICEQIEILENQGQTNSFQADRKDLWDYPDLIMHARVADDNNLMIITQEHKLIQLRVESFELFEFSIKDEFTYIPLISCFESKKLILNDSHIILSMIGDSQGQIFATLFFIQNPLKKFNFILKVDGLVNFEIEKVNFEPGIITSIELDNAFQDGVYFTTSHGYFFILNLKTLIQDLLQGQIQKNQINYKRIIIDLKSYLSSQEVLDWKIIGIQRKYMKNDYHQIWKNRIILGSVSEYLYLELLETNKKVLRILQVKKLKFPICSIITQFKEKYQEDDHFYFLSLENSKNNQQVKIVKMELNKYHSCDKVLPLKSTQYKVENMIYLKKKSWIVVNIENWNTTNFHSNKYLSQVSSQLFLLDLEANLYGFKTYSSHENNPNFKENFKFRIFPNNGEDSFFQVFNPGENHGCLQNTLFQLISVPNDSYEISSSYNDPFIVLGSYSFQGIESGIVCKSPSNQKKFFFFLVGKGLDTDKTLELVSTRVFSCLDISRLEAVNKNPSIDFNSSLQSNQIIKFGTKLVLKVEDFSITFPGKLINNAVFQKNGKTIMLNLLEPRSGLPEKFLLHQIYSELDTDFKLIQDKYDDFIGHFCQPDSVILDNEIIEDENIHIYKGFSDDISLLRIRNSFNKNSKLFIIGLQIILNYIYKRRNNEIISAFPAILTNLLFGIFDIVFSNKIKTSSSKSVSVSSGSFFSRKKVKIERKQVEDGLKNVQIFPYQISDLYSQLCSKCLKWKILMVLVVWYNLIETIINNQNIDLIYIRKLTCPIFQDWVLKLEKEIPIDFDMLLDRSYLIENFFKSDYYYEKYQELTFLKLEECVT
ncbi:uncharacterized protein cubi_02437 [Cryptosporidium ubiquitum]|uniref:Uncharacterized protein n=1 Tax=Cryptosporidium ubiquitum TaxID=857276 RepID=A0A1J4MK36_9CRYT|nr:uncharacterized protein cubi_02437 [Cryptosporidium ubiquitum]OII73205.1 hypothetical protein cubi_02437 [Cryptosporidium ubiquitum]